MSGWFLRYAVMRPFLLRLGLVPLGLTLVVTGCLRSERGRASDETVQTARQAVVATYTPPSPPDFDSSAAAAIVATPSPQGELVGKLDGASAITPNGAFTYSIPIRVPMGPGGLEPQITLTYNSRGEDGLLGVGWQLTGISKITRCAKTLAVDEQTERVLCDNTDRFCLDGSKLMLHSGTYGADGAEYRSERADYAKIVSNGSALDGPESFKVWGKDGLIREYRSVQPFVQRRYALQGESGPNEISSRNVNDTWQLVRTTDRSGNELTYHFATQDYGSGKPIPDHRLTEIRWAQGKRSVAFDYELNGATPQLSYRNGVRFARLERLKSIRVHGPNPTATAEVWRYVLDYDMSPATGRARLNGVQWCDAMGACLPKTTFAWASTREPADMGTVEWPSFKAVWTSETLDLNEPEDWARPVLADFNGDGRDDLFYHARDPRDIDSNYSCKGLVSVYPKAFVRLSNGLRPNTPVFGDPIDVSHVMRPASGAVSGPHDPFKTRVADLDNDGDMDLLAYNFVDWAADSYRFWKWSNTTQNFVLATTTPFAETSTNQAFYVFDANGDARPDLARFGQGASYYVNGTRQWVSEGAGWYLSLNNGTNALPRPQRLSSTRGGCSGDAETSDVDGDGRTEIANTCATSAISSIGLNRTGQSEVLPLDMPLRNHSPNVGDVNGDGLPDLIALVAGHPSTSPAYIDVSINTGNGFLPYRRAFTATWNIPTPYAYFDNDIVRMADFNGDGLDDLLVWSTGTHDWSNGTSTSCYVTLYPEPPRLLLSNGTDFVEQDHAFEQIVGAMPGRWKQAHPIVSQRLWSGNQLGDVDGNGIPEVIQIEGTGTSNWKFGLYAYQYQRSPVSLQSYPFPSAEEHIVRIQDGLGELQSVGYAGIANPPDGSTAAPEIYRQNSQCTWPQRCMRNGLTVVRSFQESNGRPSNSVFDNRSWIYGYEDGRSDVGGRGFLGFKCVTTSDMQRGSVERTCYDQSSESRQPKACPGWIYPFAGLPKSVEIRAPIGDGSNRLRVTQTDYLWKQPRWMTHAVFSVELDKRIVRIKEGIPTTNDLLAPVELLGDSALQRRVETQYTFDFMGNLMEELETRNAAGKTTISRTKTEFDNYTDGRWLVGVPRYQEVERQRTGEAAQKRVTRLAHNQTTGLLESVTVEPDTGNDYWYKRSYFRGVAGVVERIEEEARNQATRVTRFEYDPESVHVCRIENAEGHVTWVGTHPALGVTTVTVDPNGVTRSFKYDGFGRLRFIDEPDDADSTISYGLAATASPVPLPPIAGQVVRTRKAGGNETLEFVDTAGRPILSAWRTFTGEFAQVATTYDRIGRVASRTLAHAPGTAPAGAITSSFDLLDRPLRTTNADGTFVDRSYPSFFESRIQDEAGKITFAVSDVDGLVERSGKRDGNREVATRFTYWPFGNAHTVTDPANNVITMDYDMLGRRTKLSDPDVGIREYKYNGFGEIREESHGAKATDNGNYLYRDSYSYDRLGRLLTKTSTCLQSGQCRTEPTRKFTWDENAYGAGKLAKTEVVGDGISTLYEYDRLGRVVTEQLTVDGQVASVGTGYDTLGRLRYSYIPDILGTSAWYFVENSYDDYGYLAEVKGRDGERFWSVLSRTPEGAATVAQQYATGVANTLYQQFEYHPLTRRLTQASMVVSGAGSNAVQQRQAYDYFGNGSIRSRTQFEAFELTGSSPAATFTDNYQYDYADRLVRWTRSGRGARGEADAYNDIGNITSATSLDAAGAATGAATYAYAGTTGAGPHAATSMGSYSYDYDKGGRQTNRRAGSSSELTLSYTSFDLPYRAVFNGIEDSGTTTFRYGATEQRVLKDGPAGRTMYIGDTYERRRLPTPAGQPEEVEHVFYVHAEGRIVGQVLFKPSAPRKDVQFIYSDPLHSTSWTFDTNGAVKTAFEYAPWGRRMNAAGVELDGRTSSPVTRGYTGHEHDDELGLINMKGRLYDPRLRRFLTADPLSEVPTRMPLECIITPCDDADEMGPSGGDWSVPLTHMGGDESSYRAETSGPLGSTASHLRSNTRNTDGITLGVAEQNLLAKRAWAAPASNHEVVFVVSPDAFNRYAYANNNPIRYRDPRGYIIDPGVIFDIGFFANDVINFAQAWESGSKADLRDASIALIIDAAALILPAVPAVAGVMIRGGKAADRAADAVRATGEANNAAKAGQGAAKAAEGAKKAEQSKQALGSEKAWQQQYAQLGAGKGAPNSAGAMARSTPGVLQSGGHTINRGTARALNRLTGQNLHPRQWGRAVERLKKQNHLPNEHHGNILENGDYTDDAGEVIDNVLDYMY